MIFPSDACPAAQPFFLDVDALTGNVAKRYAATEAKAAFGEPVTKLLTSPPANPGLSGDD